MRQKLGQHFLIDQNVTDVMINSLDSRDSIVVEIGPGKGVMTEALLERGFKVLAIEWDGKLINYLTDKFSHNPNLILVEADIRTFNLVEYLESSFGGKPKYVVLANLPYYLSSFFLRQVFEYSVLPRQMILLLQREVAERLCASPRTSDRSTLSILVQSYCKPRVVLQVPPTAFNPPPEVNSAIVVLDEIDSHFYTKIDQHKFFRLVKAGFGEKRKTLLNSISGGLRMERDTTSDMLKEAKVNASERAQDLSLDEWEKIYEVWQKG